MGAVFGLDPGQIKRDLVAPVLARSRLPGDLNARITLMTGIAMRESLLRFKRQIGGPALGLWQMEPATHDNLFLDYLHYRHDLQDSALSYLPERFGGQAIGQADPALIECDAYACITAACRFAWSPVALPPAHDPAAQARAWKDGYNTGAGAGVVDAATIAIFAAAIAA